MLKSIAAVVVAGLCLAMAPMAFAAVDRPIVDSSDSRGAVRLVSAGRAATIALDADADPGVRRAATDLAEDAFSVTDIRLGVTTAAPAGSDIVVVGVVGRSALLDRRARSRKIDLSAVRGQWEASVTAVVARPWSATVLTSTHAIASLGGHVLKVSAIDPGVVVQKILIDAGGLRPSCLARRRVIV